TSCSMRTNAQTRCPISRFLASATPRMLLRPGPQRRAHLQVGSGIDKPPLGPPWKSVSVGGEHFRMDGGFPCGRSNGIFLAAEARGFSWRQKQGRGRARQEEGAAPPNAVARRGAELVVRKR